MAKTGHFGHAALSVNLASVGPPYLHTSVVQSCCQTRWILGAEGHLEHMSAVCLVPTYGFKFRRSSLERPKKTCTDVVCHSQGASICRDSYTFDGLVRLRLKFGHQLVRNDVPHLQAAVLVAAKYILSAWIDCSTVDRGVPVKRPVTLGRSRVPGLHSAIIGAAEHPSALRLAANRSHISAVDVDNVGRVWIGLNHVENSSSDVSAHDKTLVVRQEAQIVDLRLRELQRAVSRLRVQIPQPDGAIIACCGQNNVANASFQHPPKNSFETSLFNRLVSAALLPAA
mmetsp:Transcript_10451/g.31944  ORF Transcript_10451/g.31944 Transcript_10451/m.31944 type:complete len:284 (+) Transcript_10451:1317-2168(+)